MRSISVTLARRAAGVRWRLFDRADSPMYYQNTHMYAYWPIPMPIIEYPRQSRGLLFNVLCMESIILYKIIFYKNNWITKGTCFTILLVWKNMTYVHICLVLCTGDLMLYSMYSKYCIYIVNTRMFVHAHRAACMFVCAQLTQLILTAAWQPAKNKWQSSVVIVVIPQWARPLDCTMMFMRYN